MQVRDLFVSHVGEDASWARWVCWQLEDAGYGVVPQHGAGPAGPWAVPLADGLRQARALVVVVSGAYQQSGWIRAEWASVWPDAFTGPRVPILAVLLEEAAMPPRGTVPVALAGLDEGGAGQELLARVRGLVPVPSSTSADRAVAERPPYPPAAPLPPSPAMPWSPVTPPPSSTHPPMPAPQVPGWVTPVPVPAPSLTHPAPPPSSCPTETPPALPGMPPADTPPPPSMPGVSGSPASVTGYPNARSAPGGPDPHLSISPSGRAGPTWFRQRLALVATAGVATVAVVTTAVVVTTTGGEKASGPRASQTASVQPPAERETTPTQVPVAPVHLATLAEDFRGPRYESLDARGRMLAIGYNSGGVELWDVKTPASPVRTGVIERSALGLGGNLYAVGISPDGRTVAAGSNGGDVVLHDVSNPHATRQLALLDKHTDYVFHTVFSPDGRLLATGGWDKTVILWDVSDPQSPVVAARLSHTGTAGRPRFSPDGKMVATVNSGLFTLWDISTPTSPRKVAQYSGRGSLAFSPDGGQIYFGGGGALRILDISTSGSLTERTEIPAVGQTFSNLTCSSDGRLLAGSDENGTIFLWETSDIAAGISTPAARLTEHTDILEDLEFSKDSTLLVASGWRDPVILWRVA